MKISPPAGYDVAGLISSDGNWLAKFSKPKPGGSFSDAAYALFEINPENGKLLREYRVKDAHTSVACFFDHQFWGIRREKDKLVVVRGEAQPYVQGNRR